MEEATAAHEQERADEHVWQAGVVLQRWLALRANAPRKTARRTPGMSKGTRCRPEASRVYQRVLHDPAGLPQAMAACGVPVELGAAYTHHWWYAEVEGN